MTTTVDAPPFTRALLGKEVLNLNDTFINLVLPGRQFVNATLSGKTCAEAYALYPHVRDFRRSTTSYIPLAIAVNEHGNIHHPTPSDDYNYCPVGMRISPGMEIWVPRRAVWRKVTANLIGLTISSSDSIFRFPKRTDPIAKAIIHHRLRTELTQIETELEDLRNQFMTLPSKAPEPKKPRRKGVKKAALEQTKGVGTAFISGASGAAANESIKFLFAGLRKNNLWHPLLDDPKIAPLIEVAVPLILGISLGALEGQIPYAAEASQVLTLAAQEPARRLGADAVHHLGALFRAVALQDPIALDTVLKGFLPPPVPSEGLPIDILSPVKETEKETVSR